MFNNEPGLNWVITSYSTEIVPEVISLNSVFTWTGNWSKPVAYIAGNHKAGS